MAASGGFFACYLLTPQNAPQRLRCSYVGFTVSPARRLRQHNGEIVSGAKRTTKHRPWWSHDLALLQLRWTHEALYDCRDMVLVVHGFPSKFHALQFEYAWQHPFNSRFIKQRMNALKGQRGIGHPRSTRRKLIEVHEMLHLQPWSHFPLTLSYTSEAFHDLMRTNKAFYRWPDHMTCQTRPLTEFASVGKRSRGEEDQDNEDVPALGCFVCEQELTGTPSDGQTLRCYHEHCRVVCHALCLADHFLSALETEQESKVQESHLTPLRPERGQCPDCQRDLHWPLLVQHGPSSCKKTASKRRKRKQGSEESQGDGHTTQQNAQEIAAAHGLPVSWPSEPCADDGVEYDASSWFEEEESDIDAHGKYVDAVESAPEDCIDLTLEDEED